jgi:hypothetical protein
MAFMGDQEWAYGEIIRLFKEGHKRVRLVGSAGTGKTHLSNELIKYFKHEAAILRNYNNGQVFVTAPTNKALAILRSKVYGNYIFKTIHSALRMRRITNSQSGQHSFVRGKFYGDRVEDFDLAKFAVIDEASMLESKIEGNMLDPEAKEYQEGYLKAMKFPILYIGDDKQLPPVGEKVSPVFVKDYPEVKLKTIIRQGAGNPIIDLSNDLDMIYFNTPRLIDGKGYMYSNDMPVIIDDLADVNGTDALKYLAFTNNVVDKINLAVRTRRYGKPARIEKEETIVFNAPFGEHYTNKEVKVEDLSIITSYINVPRHDTIFQDGVPITATDRIRMKYYVINDTVKVLHEHSDAIFKHLSTSIKENCAKFGWDYHARDYFLEQFADIKYNHAITIHKSQGSTYKSTVMNIGDINLCRDESDKQRLLYTGVTRASDLVILNNVKGIQ